MFPSRILNLAEAVVSQASARGWRIGTAESCTGGLVAGALTAVTGASGVLDRAAVTYSNTAKTQMIGVAPSLIAQHGAVSKPVAVAMAEGARASFGTDLAVAITGIAGPGGGSDEKPVGLVHFSVSAPQGTVHVERRFGPLGREAIRMASVEQALDMLKEALA